MIELKKQLKISRKNFLRIGLLLVIYLVSLFSAFLVGRFVELSIHQQVLMKISDVNTCVKKLDDV